MTNVQSAASMLLEGGYSCGVEEDGTEWFDDGTMRFTVPPASVTWQDGRTDPLPHQPLAMLALQDGFACCVLPDGAEEFTGNGLRIVVLSSSVLPSNPVQLLAARVEAMRRPAPLFRGRCNYTSCLCEHELGPEQVQELEAATGAKVVPRLGCARYPLIVMW